MNILHLTIIECVIFIISAIFLGKILYNNFNSLNIVFANFGFWLALIVLSILLNFKKYVYFVGMFLITIIVSVMLILKLNIRRFFTDKLYLIFYLLVPISFIVLLNFLVSKYFIYNMSDTEAPKGNVGERGSIGESGTNYFTETYAERCYVDLINNLENTFQDIKNSNDIEYDTKDYHINNFFLKSNLKRICYSNEFLDHFYKNKNNDIIPECVAKYNDSGNIIGRRCNNNNNICNNNSDCFVSSSNINTYNNLLKILKNKSNIWLKTILRNNCKEDIRLRNKLGGNVTETLEDLYNNGEIDNNYKYNSSVGKRFLKSDFENDKYLDKELNKNINKNPFKNPLIKDDPYWKWGFPPKKCPE